MLRAKRVADHPAHRVGAKTVDRGPQVAHPSPPAKFRPAVQDWGYFRLHHRRSIRFAAQVLRAEAADRRPVRFAANQRPLRADQQPDHRHQERNRRGLAYPPPFHLRVPECHLRQKADRWPAPQPWHQRVPKVHSTPKAKRMTTRQRPPDTATTAASAQAPDSAAYPGRGPVCRPNRCLRGAGAHGQGVGRAQ